MAASDWIRADEWQLTVHGFGSLAVEEVVPDAVFKVQFREEFPLVRLLDGERDWDHAKQVFEQFGVRPSAGVNMWLLEPTAVAGDWVLERADELMTADQVDGFTAAHGEGGGLWAGWCVGENGRRRAMTAAERLKAAADRAGGGHSVSEETARLLAGWRPSSGSWPFAPANEGWTAIRAVLEPAGALTATAVRWAPPAAAAPAAFRLTGPAGIPRLVVYGRPGAWAGLVQERNVPLTEKEMQMVVSAEQLVAWAEQEVCKLERTRVVCPTDRPSHQGDHLTDVSRLFESHVSVTAGRQLAPVTELVAEVLQSPVRYRTRRDLMRRAEELQVRGRGRMDNAKLRSEVAARARLIADEVGVGALFLRFKSIVGPAVSADAGAAEAVLTRAVNMFAHDGFEQVSHRLSSVKETQCWEGFAPVNPFAGAQAVSSQFDPGLTELDDDIPF